MYLRNFSVEVIQGPQEEGTFALGRIHQVTEFYKTYVLLEDLVRLATVRLRIKCEFEEMKGEMGPNHYEGRTGWDSTTMESYAWPHAPFLSPSARGFPPRTCCFPQARSAIQRFPSEGVAGASDRHVDSSIATLRIYQARDLAHKPALLPVVRGEVRSSHFMTQ